MTATQDGGIMTVNDSTMPITEPVVPTQIMIRTLFAAAGRRANEPMVRDLTDLVVAAAPKTIGELTVFCRLVVGGFVAGKPSKREPK